MNEKELLVFEKLANFQETGFAEVMSGLPFSREPTFRYLQSLFKQGLINKKKIANLFVYSINMKSNEAISLLSYTSHRKAKQLDANIEDFVRESRDKNILFVLLTKTDSEKKKPVRASFLVICSQNKKEVDEKIQKVIKTLEYKRRAKISASCYLLDDFVSNIKDRPGYLKSLLVESTPVFNPERFYTEIRDFL